MAPLFRLQIRSLPRGPVTKHFQLPSTRNITSFPNSTCSIHQQTPQLHHLHREIYSLSTPPRRSPEQDNYRRIASTRTMATALASGPSLVDSAKKAAAYQAVDEYLLKSHKFIGIGSGSTVVFVVDAIVNKGLDFYRDMTFVPTGSQSKGLIKAGGLRVCNLDERPLVNGNPVALDVVFDGADEIDEELNLIKGGGGCLFQEKLVAIAAKKFVAVADYRKNSARLCTQWKNIPIEVLPMAAPDVLARLRAMGSSNPTIRSGLPSKAGECVTDNGMWIIDVPFPSLLLSKDLSSSKGDGSGRVGDTWEVEALARELLSLPGVAEIGLFTGFNGDQAKELGKEMQAQKPIAAFFGMQDGTVQVRKA